MGPSTFGAVFVDGRPQIHGAVHVLGRFCGREASNSWCRPRFRPFLWTGGFKFMGPSTFEAVFMDGRLQIHGAVHVLGRFCGREPSN